MCSVSLVHLSTAKCRLLHSLLSWTLNVSTELENCEGCKVGERWEVWRITNGLQWEAERPGHVWSPCFFGPLVVWQMLLVIVKQATVIFYTYTHGYIYIYIYSSGLQHVACRLPAAHCPFPSSSPKGSWIIHKCPDLIGRSASLLTFLPNQNRRLSRPPSNTK